MTASACPCHGTMGSEALLCSLAMLIERVGEEEAAPTLPLQNWGRGLRSLLSASEVRQAAPGRTGQIRALAPSNLWRSC